VLTVLLNPNLPTNSNWFSVYPCTVYSVLAKSNKNVFTIERINPAISVSHLFDFHASTLLLVENICSPV